MYDSAAEANRRLQRSVIMYDGYPVYVNGCADDRDGEVCVAITPLPKMRDELSVKLNDPKLDYRNLPLGYVNGTREARYYLRRAYRHQIQGLCDANVTCANVKPDDGIGGLPRFRDLFRSSGLVDCMKGVYPSLEEAKAQLDNPDGEKSSVAFHRTLALYKDPRLGYYKLLHRGEEIAWGSCEGFILPTLYEHLREQLTELGVKAS